MAAYLDGKTNKWYASFWYSTFNGDRKKKLKRGFSLKREAIKWERDFLDKQEAQPDMLFSSLVEIYLEDMSHRLKVSTMHTKKSMIENNILPFFSEYRINAIKPPNIRRWQNEKINSGLSNTYLRQLNTQLSAIFNYAVRFYGLSENPILKAGTMGKANADEMDFWTKEEYLTFREAIRNRTKSLVAFDLLYFTGMRFGEFIALTKEDIDIENHFVDINKTLSRIKKVDYITEPKTKKAIRNIPIPVKVTEELQDYFAKMYELKNKDRIFMFTNKYMMGEIKRGCELSGIKAIRIHDIRHSHASLLINMGYSIRLIADRLGHEKIETTLNTYGHLYPDEQSKLANELNKML